MRASRCVFHDETTCDYCISYDGSILCFRATRSRGLLEAVVHEAFSPGENEASLFLLNIVVFVLFLFLLLTLFAGLVNIHIILMLVMTCILAVSLALYVLLHAHPYQPYFCTN